MRIMNVIIPTWFKFEHLLSWALSPKVVHFVHIIGMIKNKIFVSVASQNYLKKKNSLYIPGLTPIIQLFCLFYCTIFTLQTLNYINYKIHFTSMYVHIFLNQCASCAIRSAIWLPYCGLCTSKWTVVQQLSGHCSLIGCHTPLPCTEWK